MVCVIDIGFGNISSIKNWLSRCVIDFEIVENQRDLSDFKLIILLKHLIITFWVLVWFNKLLVGDAKMIRKYINSIG